MAVERNFLRSLYLTLALAGACLAYVCAQTHFYEVAVVSVPLTLFLLTTYRAESFGLVRGRTAAALDLTLAAAAGLWFAAVFVRLRITEGDPVAWPVQMLPHMGMWIVILMLAKLARPKGVRDYWWLQLMGFMAVALACSLDSTFLFSFLLAGYAVCVLWNLACFQRYAEEVQSRPLPSVVVPGRAPSVGQALWRCGLIGGVGVALYLVTPRHSVTAWEESMFRPQPVTGLGDAQIDLNRSGTIRSSTAVAFQVKATDANGKPKTDLDTLNQRWRGVVLNNYDGGRWTPRPWLMRTGIGPGEPGDGLPDLGPRQYFLHFEFTNRIVRLPAVAEPVASPDVPVEFLLYGREEPMYGLRHPDGELRAPWQLRRFYCNNYRQVCVPLPVGISGPVDVPPAQFRNYCQLPALPELKPWLAQVLQQLVQNGALNATDVRPGTDGTLPAEQHEKVARALEHYLGESGHYSYTLNQPRKDRAADPVIDFLCNVKDGHCERFASGLTVMLRSLGIPARVITGFRGAEHLGEGTYHIRQNQAHSWVEALVQRPSDDGPELHWLTLDPTPAEDQGIVAQTALGRWWRELQNQGGALWRNFVVEYNAEQQEAALTEWFGPIHLPIWLIWLVAPIAVVLVLWLVYRVPWRRSWSRPAERGESFYTRWQATLARRCRLEAEPGQTPREFAQVVAEHFRSIATLAPFAGMAEEVAETYYRLRYAGQSLPAAEAQAVEARIRECDRVLATLGKAAWPVAKPATVG